MCNGYRQALATFRRRRDDISSFNLNRMKKVNMTPRPPPFACSRPSKHSSHVTAHKRSISESGRAHNTWRIFCLKPADDVCLHFSLFPSAHLWEVLLPWHQTRMLP